MTQALAPVASDAAAIMERVVIVGDIGKLTPQERVAYYAAVCESVGLNPLTRPFDYLVLNGKTVLYANKGCTDQLRSIKGISIDRAERDASDPEFATWLVTGHDAAGRVDTEIGSVSIKGLSGEARANAIMKALTKGKRRLTLSLAGLGFLDETEVDSIPGAVRADVDAATGEVRRLPATPAQSIAAARERVRTTEAAGTTRRPTGTEPSAAPDPVTVEPVAGPPLPAAGEADIVEAVAVEVDPVQCDSRSPYDPPSRCGREMGHPGAHRNREKETWQ